jgi:ubiquinone/menaquinone biosynthesis C-methylase UbiE
MEGFLNPKEILSKLELNKEMTAADFGSGSGGWAIPLAKILKDGKVYAIDILEEPLSALKNKAELEGIDNIELIRYNIESSEGSKLGNNFLDLVLITNLLFEAKDKKGVISEAKRVTKNGGRILIIDWLPNATLGPEGKRTSPEEIRKLAEGLDLKSERELKAGDYHFGMILRKI